MPEAAAGARTGAVRAIEAVGTTSKLVAFNFRSVPDGMLAIDGLHSYLNGK